LKATAVAVADAQRDSYDACVDAIPTPIVADKTGLDDAKYAAEMEKIIDAHYKCLRTAYDANMKNEDPEKRVPTFYVPANGFCGPTGPVDAEAEGEQELGLRC